jgi:CheY-like chemotaxis protein
MVKNVLLVDDDREMLLTLKEGFDKYRDSFAVHLASDGFKAVTRLKKSGISLVVTDLKMPGMDGFELLAHIMENYPDIPVIITTGYSTPEMEHLARDGGAIGYSAKPLLIENLAHQIMTTLRQESEGGRLHNVSSGMFLQLVEMEQKTCTIRLEDKSTGKKGILFFLEGELLDARVNALKGEDAAYEVLSWEQVNLSIQNGCVVKEKRIHSEMQYLILEAARRRDENIVDEAPPAVLKAAALAEIDPRTVLNSIKDKIERDVGPACGLEDLYQDDSWDSLIFQLNGTGEYFNIGKMMLGYIDKGQTNDFILLPGEKTTVIAVNPKCPRDKLLQVLSE